MRTVYRQRNATPNVKVSIYEVLSSDLMESVTCHPVTHKLTQSSLVYCLPVCNLFKHVSTRKNGSDFTSHARVWFGFASTAFSFQLVGD